MKPKNELLWQSDRDLADRVHLRNTPLRKKSEYEIGREKEKKKAVEEALKKLRSAQETFKDKPTEQKSLFYPHSEEVDQ